ncbi:hypothetical protein BDF14DRAFT_1886487 [Spinellus fusiger]|nr:hypothetical protein BDF14DRAFT_1886487 [Spinellus fusiger]
MRKHTIEISAPRHLKASQSEIVVSKNQPSSQPNMESMQHDRENSSKVMGQDARKSVSQFNLSDIPSLNLSFFDNESSDMIDLAKNLGANLSLDVRTPYSPSENQSLSSPKTPSTLLTTRNSYRRTTSSTVHPITNATTNNNNNNHPTKCIPNTLARHDSLSRTSKPSLEVQQQTKRNSSLRDQWTYHQAEKAKESTFSILVKEEIDRLAQSRIELNKACEELRHSRDVLANDIASSVQTQAGLVSQNNVEAEASEFKKALYTEIQSLMAERDALKADTQNLSKMRDEIIHETILLNTKNGELTKINNELSQRAIEHELQSNKHIPHSPSPSPSTELIYPMSMQRQSSEGSAMTSSSTTSREPPTGKHEAKIMRLKKKGSAMFGKLSIKSKADSAIYLYNSDYAQSSKSLLYDMSHANSSNQSLSVEGLMGNQRQKPKMSLESIFSGSGSVFGSGPHAFHLTSFLRPVKCNACNEKMWGRHEYRCQGCGYVCHTKCVNHVPQLCSASNTSLDLSNESDLELAKSSSLFGRSLTDRVEEEGRTVPLLVERCIQAVESRGMKYEGIYRKSGGAAQMRIIQVAFEQGVSIDLEDRNEFNDLAAITSILKQYFRELPDPLLTYDVYPLFIEAIAMKVDQTKVDKFISLMKQLPKANYDTLKLLMQHLNRIQQHSSDNLMTTKNLAMVFAPTLMRDKDASRDFLDMSYKNATMDFVIGNAFELFV